MIRRSRSLLPVVAFVLAASACGGQTHAAPPQVSRPSASPSPTAPVPPDSSPPPPSSDSPAPPTSAAPQAAPRRAAADGCPLPQSGFDCDLQRRIAQAKSYVTERPGSVGIVVRDRQTGAVWRNEHAGDQVWTASTIKLAMTVDLFLRDRDGSISLSDHDRSLIQAMLHSSDDGAADELWYRYAGEDHMAFNDDFPRYGLTSLQPQKGFSKFYPYWGFQKCTADDLDRLINYVLTQLPADDRSYVVEQLRTVGPEQQWGVWGAGPAARPGNKDGWSEEQGGWVMNTVGFVGPGERYTLSVMNALGGEGGYQEGRDTDSEVARLLFAGRF